MTKRQLAERAVESAVDAALGEVQRQAGYMPQIFKEARSIGLGAAQPFLSKMTTRTIAGPRGKR